MTKGFASRVVLCWPSRRSDIDKLNTLVDDDRQKFEPTVDHSLSSCDSCERGIWITPQQLELARSTLTLAKKLCLFCVADVHETLNLELREVDIGPETRQSRRRRV